MEGKLSWSSFKPIASLLQENHPHTDLLTLSDEDLMEMISHLDATHTLSDMPKDKTFFLAIKTAWENLRHPDDNEGEDPSAYDAYI